MPYVNCARCGLVNFTVAYWSSVDRCAGCGEPARRGRDSNVALAGRAQTARPRAQAGSDQELPERSRAARGSSPARQGPDTGVMAPRPMQFERRELSGLTWFILVAGIPASILACACLARLRARREPRASSRSSARRSCRSGSPQDVRRHDQLLLSAAGLFAASNEVERAEFSAFATAVELRAPASRRTQHRLAARRPAHRRGSRYATLHERLGRARAGSCSGGGPRAGARAGARRGPAGAHQDLRPRRAGARRPGDGAARSTRAPALRAALRARRAEPARLGGAQAARVAASSPRTCARSRAQGRAVLFSPSGQPVSWSTHGPVAAASPTDDDVHPRGPPRPPGRHVGAADLARRVAREDPVDRAGPSRDPVPGRGAQRAAVRPPAASPPRGAARRGAGRGDLRDNEEQFRALATSSPVGICLLDDAEECRYVNQRWADIHGIAPAAGDREGAAADPGCRPTAPPGQAAIERGRQGEETTIECRVRRPEGGERWVLYRGAPLRHENGEIRGWVVSAVDVTDRKTYEAELKRRALHDELTGLPNRALLMEQLAHALAAGTPRRGAPPACCSSTSTASSTVNDSFGHAAGDEVIRTAARRLDQTVRPGDTRRPLRERRVRGHLRGRGATRPTSCAWPSGSWPTWASRAPWTASR